MYEPDKPLWGGTNPDWGQFSAVLIDYTHTDMVAYNSLFSNGPLEYDIYRGDFIISAFNSPYSQEILNSTGSGSAFFNGALTFWSTLTISQKLSIIWVWVDLDSTLHNNGTANSYMTFAKLQPRIDMGTDANGNQHVFAATGRYDSREGRKMELYKREPQSTPPPSGSGGGSHWWDSVQNGWLPGAPTW